MKKLILIILIFITANGCEVGRRAYLQIRHKVVRNLTSAMLPNIKPGDYLVIDRIYYSTKPVQRFDLVVVKHPGEVFVRYPEGSKNGADLFVVKRVIAMGGETIEIRSGRVYINGAELKQPFAIVPHEPPRNLSLTSFLRMNIFSWATIVQTAKTADIMKDAL